MEHQNKGYYLYTFDPNNPNPAYLGVTKKISNQISCFQKNGITCELLPCIPKSLIRRGIGTLPLISDGIEWPSIDNIDNPSFLYIRKPAIISKEFVNFLNMIKERFPKVLIILELPTYPYDNEMKNPAMYLGLLKDQKYRTKLKQSVDFISAISKERRIFDIPVLSFMNGINIETLSKRKPSGSVESGAIINLVFVAQFSSWHGADRLIEGLASYYKKGGTKEVVVHMAGAGSDINNLKALVKKYQLEKRIIFYGNISGKKLDELYDKCSFAIASLALHRIGHEIASTLKTREYLAKGIPFVYAGKIDVFESKPVDFALQIPLNNSCVDIKKIIEFHDNLYTRETEHHLIDRIRNYAKETVDLSHTMKEIIKKLQTGTNA